MRQLYHQAVSIAEDVVQQASTRNPQKNVIFETPNIHRLRDKGYTAVDMHLHTAHSDGMPDVKRMLAKARAEGFGVAVTDHNEVSGSLMACSLAEDVLVIPGIEVSCADGPHVLAYFYSPSDLEDFFRRVIRPARRSSPWLAVRASTSHLVDELERYPCLTVAAHPYGYLLFNKGVQKCIDAEYLPEDILEGFEGYEVLCGGMTRALNLKAMQAAWERRLCYTGGTDAHTLQDYGRVVTCAYASDAPSFLTEVEKRKNIIVGLEKDPLMKVFTGTVMMGKHSRYFLPSMRVHLEQNLPRLPHYFKRKIRDLEERAR
ncbi:MAG: PHP-associated domain-containing protein [Methanomassiliicoccales archaeon]